MTKKKNNRKCTVLFLLVLITSLAQAQTIYGVRNGLGLTAAERKNDKESTEDISAMMGYQIGIASEKILMLTATYLFGDHPSPHPKMNYNAQTDTIKKTYRFKQPNKREKIYLHLSQPQFNFLRIMPENEDVKGSRGIFGGSIGLDYHHSYNQFIHFEVSAFSNSGIILPPPNDEDMMSSGGINLSNNHKFGRFSLGYGLSYSEYTWGKYSWFFVVIPKDTKSHNAFGLVFPAYFHAAKFLNIGVVYKPTFYRPNISKKFSYEHLVSIDFAWKIRLL